MTNPYNYIRSQVGRVAKLGEDHHLLNPLTLGAIGIGAGGASMLFDAASPIDVDPLAMAAGSAMSASRDPFTKTLGRVALGLEGGRFLNNAFNGDHPDIQANPLIGLGLAGAAYGTRYAKGLGLVHEGFPFSESPTRIATPDVNSTPNVEQTPKPSTTKTSTKTRIATKVAETPAQPVQQTQPKQTFRERYYQHIAGIPAEGRSPKRIDIEDAPSGRIAQSTEAVNNLVDSSTTLGIPPVAPSMGIDVQPTHTATPLVQQVFESINPPLERNIKIVEKNNPNIREDVTRFPKLEQQLSQEVSEDYLNNLIRPHTLIEKLFENVDPSLGRPVVYNSDGLLVHKHAFSVDELSENKLLTDALAVLPSQLVAGKSHLVDSGKVPHGTYHPNIVGITSGELNAIASEDTAGYPMFNSSIGSIHPIAALAQKMVNDRKHQKWMMYDPSAREMAIEQLTHYSDSPISLQRDAEFGLSPARIS
jgi:hypothetical protein